MSIASMEIMPASKSRIPQPRLAVIELTGAHVTFCLVEFGRERPRVRWKRLPVELDNEGSHAQVNPTALTALLKEVVLEEKLHGATVSVVLGGDQSVTRVVAGGREHVQNELRELRNRSSLYLSLGHGPKMFAESVLAIDAKRAQGAITVTNEPALLGVLQAVKDAGLKVVSVEHSLVALCRAVGKIGLDADSPVLIVEFNQRGIDLGVSHRGRLLLDYRPGGQGEHQQMAEVALKHLGRIQRHCSRHFQFVDSRISQVVICGAGTEADELRRFFEKTGGMKAETLDPCAICPEWAVEDAGKEESWLAPLLGAVLDREQRTANDGAPDLMAPLRLLQREPIWPVLSRIGWPVAAAVLLTFAIYGVGLYEHSRVARLEVAAEKATHNQQLLTAQQLALSQVDKKVKYLQVISERVASPAWHDFLLDLGDSLPEGTWLENVRVDSEGTVSLSGPSYDEDMVYELVDRLKKIPTLTNVALEGTRSARFQTGPVTMYEVRAVYTGGNDNTADKKGG